MKTTKSGGSRPPKRPFGSKGKRPVQIGERSAYAGDRPAHKGKRPDFSPKDSAHKRPERRPPERRPRETGWQGGFPTPLDVTALVAQFPDGMTKKDLSRAFGISDDDKQRFKTMLHLLVDERALNHEGLRYRATAALPSVLVAVVRAVTEEGALLASPVEGSDEDILIPLDINFPMPPAVGARVLVRLVGQEGSNALGTLMRVLPPSRSQMVMGVFRFKDGKGMIESADKRGESYYYVSEKNRLGAAPGQLVRAETFSGPRRERAGAADATIVEIIGDAKDPKAASLIAIHTHDIPFVFPAAAEREAESAPAPIMQPGRVDLRHIPLVTIDGEDARDFDDAVFAEPDDAAGNNPGGWHLVVAIADVAHYVRVGSALDTEAALRGNSVYFPDRVVPMLPEALSNGLCSLKPKEDRYCLAMHLWLDRDGALKRHRLDRAIMRSAARLTYEQVQAAHDEKGDATTAPLMNNVIRPLYRVYRLLHKQRWQRGALDIDLPEYKVDISAEGVVRDIFPRERLDSHRLIEEMMILANVAAAKLLHTAKVPTLYRVHETPDPNKLRDLVDFLDQLGQKLHAQDGITALKFNELFARVRDLPIAQVVHMATLRTQMQAYYGPERLGHFGLALTDYAHFTSPIRRYSDLVVHRGLIAALKLGDDGLSPEAAKDIGRVGEHISFTERRAMMAERDARDRYTAAFLTAQMGQEVFGVISGVARTGLFVMLERTGADGYIPLQALAQDYFVVDERRKLVRGRKTGITLTLGDRVRVRIDDANGLNGRLRLSFLEHLPYRRVHKDRSSKPVFKNKEREVEEKPAGKKYDRKSAKPPSSKGGAFKPAGRDEKKLKLNRKRKPDRNMRDE
jgi:ribonuclease R